MAVIESTTVKAVASVAGAGLLATIARDPDFWVLFGSAILISSASFTYDLHRAPSPGKYILNFTTWVKYVIAGLCVMFFAFHGLVEWVPEAYQLPLTVWYFMSITLAGYGVPILDKAKDFMAPIADKILIKVFK